MGEILGRKVCYDGDFVPAWAELVSTVECTRVRGVARTRVFIAIEQDEDFGNTVWSWAETDGTVPVILAVTESMTYAESASERFIAAHDKRMLRLSHTVAGVQVDI